MREIKFRAWDSTPKEIYGQTMLEWDTLLSLDMDGLLFLRDILSGTHTNLFPMQFTGLKDKNGQEIYEGDILRVICGCGYTENLPVLSREEYNGFCLSAGEQHNWDNGQLKLTWPSYMKVIGNRYENPELLGEK